MTALHLIAVLKSLVIRYASRGALGYQTVNALLVSPILISLSMDQAHAGASMDYTIRTPPHYANHAIHSVLNALDLLTLPAQNAKVY